MTLYQVRMHDGDLKFVVAEDGFQAQQFLGVRDGSASVHPVAWEVEIVGFHPAHDALTPVPVTVVVPEARGTMFSAFDTGYDSRLSGAGVNPSELSQACQDGTCDCAPLCGRCGKGKMWDSKAWGGEHLWNCPECHAKGSMPWKAKEAEDVTVN